MTRPRPRRPLPHSRAPRPSHFPHRPPNRWRFRLRWLVIILLMMPLMYYINWLDAAVTQQFKGKLWALPARVYASPLELYPGMQLTAQQLSHELQSIGYRVADQLNASGMFQRYRNDILIQTRAFRFWDAHEPSRKIRVRFAREHIRSISNVTDNQRLALARIEPKLIGKIYPTHNEDRILVRLEDLPDNLRKAIIAVEDRQFYHHYGLSLRGLARAMLANLKAGDWVQGGSTITQQLVKNMFLSSERTLMRKINEALMALILEWHYSKDQILETYINEVYLGQDGKRAIHGMGMAAWFYFDRPLNELTLSEHALLVSLIRGASHYNPRRHAERALERRNMVLDIMTQQGVLNEADAEIAKFDPLTITPKAKDTVSPYPAFLDLVKQQLRQDYREEDLHSSGLQVFTTLDPLIQRMAEGALVNGIKRLEKTHRKKKVRKLEGAIVVTGSENGEVLALANGRRPRFAGFNRPLNARRQIGSLVKPAVYLTALEQPRTYSLISRLNDTAFEWENKRTGEVWQPQNYDYKEHGDVPLHYALAHSYNLATVHLGMELGLSNVLNTLKRLGLKREFNPYPSVLLGSMALSPLEVTQMYQTIASGGFRVPLRAIRDVLNHEGKPLQRYALEVEQSFDAAPIFLLNYALQAAVRQGTGRGVAQSLPEELVFAGKTGTTNDYRDSWFSGFSSDILAVTWLGRDDNRPINLSGGDGAMVVWKDFMQKFKPQAQPPMVPRTVKWRWVDYRSGRVQRHDGRNTVRMPFISSRVVSTPQYLAQWQ